ncbi:hypothetical protein G6F57_022951 [Rhizopus arrhizus]|nr:hypothetical protein G6F57_022951 [Rhizopus arrhizus]
MAEDAGGGSGAGDGRRRARAEGLGRVCGRRRRHRPLQDGQVRAARTAGSREVRRVLGREAPAEDRPRGDAAAARSQLAHGRADVRPGRLDRGARARRFRRDQGSGFRHLFQ